MTDKAIIYAGIFEVIRCGKKKKVERYQAVLGNEIICEMRIDTGRKRKNDLTVYDIGRRIAEELRREGISSYVMDRGELFYHYEKSFNADKEIFHKRILDLERGLKEGGLK